MKKFLSETEILLILSSYLHHIEVLLMTSYRKIFIGFPSITPENPSFKRNKHNDLKREMTSSTETGGAASIHIILCVYNNSLIEIKTNVSMDRILKLRVKGNFVKIACDILKGNINTQKIWMCRRRGKCSWWVDVKCAGHITQLLASYYEEYSQIAGHENAIKLKI